MRLANSNRFRPLCRILLATLTGLLATATFAQTVEPTPADLRLIPQNEAQIKLSFAPVVKQVAPAVVNVYASRKVVQRQRVSPFFEDPFFRRFFGQPGGSGRPRERVESSLGSGVIISADGTVITNHHVIKGADAVRVALSDRREFDADIVLMDERTDLAVLKIRGEGPYEHVSFANSDSLEVGDIVLAIGNPFGLGGSVTAGIVSARGRDIGAGPYDDFIQIDAPVNRGNSGGPAFNMNGEVIGVNAAIFSPSGGNVGIAFAIPASTAQDVIMELKDGGTVVRGWLGVQIQNVTEDIADSLGLEKAQGAIVAEAQAGSPAEKAGLRSGDTILAVDGAKVEGPRDLSKIIAAYNPDTKVEITVWRDGKTQDIDVMLGRLKEQQQAAATPEATEKQTTSLDDMGLVLSTKAEAGLEGDGVVIAEIDPDGPAAEKRLRQGDVILEVAGMKVNSPEDVLKAVKKAEEDGRKAVLFRVETNDTTRFVALPMNLA